MRTASHIAAALRAATGRSTGSHGWQLVGACPAYWGTPSSFKLPNRGSTLKPE
jgi:hypothetical protein